MLRSHRLASLSDLPRIVDIYNATIASRQVTADLVPITVESRLQWFNEHNPKTRPLWVLEENNQVVAWLSFSSFYGRPAYHQTVEISLYVDESARRMGIGTHLLSEAIKKAPDCNIKSLLAFIFRHNQPSLALFENFGFQRWGILPGIAQMDGIDRDLVILGQKLHV